MKPIDAARPVNPRLRGRLWRGFWILLAVWFVVLVTRWIMGVPGHLGVMQAVGAGICVLAMTMFSGWMFRYLGGAAVAIWIDRWRWLFRRGERPFNGVMEFIVYLIMELGIYYFAFLTGYGVVLGAYVLGSLAWNGNVALGISGNLIVPAW